MRGPLKDKSTIMLHVRDKLGAASTRLPPKSKSLDSMWNAGVKEELIKRKRKK